MWTLKDKVEENSFKNSLVRKGVVSIREYLVERNKALCSGLGDGEFLRRLHGIQGCSLVGAQCLES